MKKYIPKFIMHNLLLYQKTFILIVIRNKKSRQKAIGTYIDGLESATYIYNITKYFFYSKIFS